MSFPDCQMTVRRQCFLICVIMLGFVVIFFTYYNLDYNIPILCSDARGENHSCQCPVEAMTTSSNTDVHESPADTKPDTVVLLWMWPFGYKDRLSCDQFNIRGCHLTLNRSLYQKAHGVIFHHRDIGAMPTEPRPWFQKWVWFNMESPANSREKPELDHLFNLTMNYRLDSNILMPYGYLEALESETGSFQLPAKDKLVCWVVSHWEAKMERVNYYNELKKHINISVYGQAFGKHLAKDDYNPIVSSCKFYLAFENSVHKDYFTEKLFNPLMFGTVPVVLGPPRQNYERVVPPHSFLHVNDFPSPEDLAKRLLYLDKNNDEYLRYFDWKKGFNVKKHLFTHEASCKTCSYLQKNRGYQAFNGLNKWYWG